MAGSQWGGGTGGTLGLCPAHIEVQRLVLWHKLIYELQALLSLSLFLMCPEGGGVNDGDARALGGGADPSDGGGTLLGHGDRDMEVQTCSAPTPPMAGTAAGTAVRAAGASCPLGSGQRCPQATLRDGSLCCSGSLLQVALPGCPCPVPKAQLGALGRQEGSS